MQGLFVPVPRRSLTSSVPVFGFPRLGKFVTFALDLSKVIECKLMLCCKIKHRLGTGVQRDEAADLANARMRLLSGLKHMAPLWSNARLWMWGPTGGCWLHVPGYLMTIKDACSAPVAIHSFDSQDFIQTTYIQGRREAIEGSQTSLSVTLTDEPLKPIMTQFRRGLCKMQKRQARPVPVAPSQLRV